MEGWGDAVGVVDVEEEVEELAVFRKGLSARGPNVLLRHSCVWTYSFCSCNLPTILFALSSSSKRALDSRMRSRKTWRSFRNFFLFVGARCCQHTDLVGRVGGGGELDGWEGKGAGGGRREGFAHGRCRIHILVRLVFHLVGALIVKGAMLVWVGGEGRGGHDGLVTLQSKSPANGSSRSSGAVCRYQGEEAD